MSTDQDNENSPTPDDEIDPYTLNYEGPMEVTLNREESLFLLDLLNRKPRVIEGLRDAHKRPEIDLDPNLDLG